MSVQLLIVTRYDDPESLCHRVAGRQLLRGLESRSIRWQLHQPWLPDPDLRAFDAALFWTYRFHRKNYIFWANQLAARLRKLGIPVINSPEKTDAPHSFFLETWREHGVPCPRCQSFRSFEHSEIGYPLILRCDGIHMGQDVHLIDTADQARALIEERRAAVLSERPRNNFREYNLAIEFVDTSDSQGIFRKWRSVVIGDTIIPRHLLLSRHWLVNFGNLVSGPEAEAEDRRFMAEGEAQPDLVRQAARLTGADIVALDYGKFPDGRYVFWEANRHFLLLGDTGYEEPEKFQAATGRNTEEREAQDETIGLAMADLVLSRVGAG